MRRRWMRKTSRWNWQAYLDIPLTAVKTTEQNHAAVREDLVRPTKLGWKRTGNRDEGNNTTCTMPK